MTVGIFEHFRFAREPHLRGRVNTVDSDPKWISADGNMYIEILTDETYEEFVAENEEVMIFWVAEGCIRCYEIVQVCNDDDPRRQLSRFRKTKN